MLDRDSSGFKRCASIALPAILGLAPSLHLAAEPLFPTPVFRVAGPGERRSLTCDIGAISDVNNDGHLDVVSTIFEQTSTANLSDVSILLGEGNGRFGPPLRFPVYFFPQTVTVADFNRDGAADLAVGGLALEVSLLLGQGDGSFPSASMLPVATGRVLSVVSGDFNGDGAPDVAAGNSRSSTVDLLVGAGDGTFAPHTGIPTGPHPYSVLVDDFNLDSIVDLASANYGAQFGEPASIGVALGLGDGTFSAPVLHLTGPEGGISPSHHPHLLKGGDYNNDGFPDLLARGLGSTSTTGRPLLLLLGRGDGSFDRGPEVPLRHSSTLIRYHANSFATGDLDGDGELDIVAAPHGVQLATGRGDGTFDPAVRLDLAWNSNSLAIQDVNEDQLPDLLVLGGSDDLLVYLNDGQGVPAPPPSVALGGPARGVTEGDFNNDARPDLAVVTVGPDGTQRQRAVSVFYGQEDRSFSPPILFTVADLMDLITTGDFNGDSRDDLVVWSSSALPESAQGGIRIYLSSESGFTPSFLSVVSVANPAEVVAADLNLDGVPDLGVLSHTADEISVHLGRGDGTFVDGSRIAVGTEVRSLIVARLDGDPFPDFALADGGARRIPILAGDGQGQFTPRPAISTEFEPVSVVPGHLDGDALMDLLVATRDDGDTGFAPSRTSVYLGDGDGSYRLHGIESFLPQFIADFNADGVLDVASGTASGHAIHLGRGDGTFLPETRFHNAGTNGRSLAADFDNDGRVDLASAGPSKLTLLYNQGPFPVHSVAIDIVPGSQSNPVNPASHGVTAVAILGAPDLAATDVIPGTIRLAGASVWTDPRLGRPKCRTTDVNDDGRPDLVCHVQSSEMSLTPDSLEAELTAEMPDGIRIRGRDAVRVIGPVSRRND